MSADAPKPPRAWEPLTPAGVAAFARAPLWRLLLAQFIVALLAAGVVCWFLEEEWFPVVRAAVAQLPSRGEIRGGLLDWPAVPPARLAGNHFLEVVVDPAHTNELVRDAQLRVEFGHADLWLRTVTGDAVVPYPTRWRAPFNQTELVPWWGAWEQAIVAAVAVTVFLGLFISWFALATLYCLPVKLITLYENRDLKLGQSWRLAGAALIPGALFLIFAIVFYALSSMALVQLAVVWCLHLVAGWIYLFLSPMFLPRHPEAAARGNPFSTRKK